MEASKLKKILEQHRIWIETNGVQGARADLSGANLIGAELRGANLSGANLRDANLGDANLVGANLVGANLVGANLVGADLTGANLQGAYLRGANLIGADLTGANLTGASLRGANLTGASLQDAILTGANLTNAILPDISWIIPGCLAQLSQIKYYGFYLEKERKYENFIQDSIGFFIQDNPIQKTFDILVGDRIIRNIPHWVKYSGLKQIE